MAELSEQAEGTEQVAAAEESGTERKGRGHRKSRVGVVVSDKMDKTVVVKIERLVKHPVYGRYVRRAKKYKVHDAENQCRVGDVISFVESRPLSKDKCWRFVEFVRRAE
jgi:small subunit ribosomal protein S17